MDQINRVLVVAGREQAGRGASPTLAIVDAQSVAPHLRTCRTRTAASTWCAALSGCAPGIRTAVVDAGHRTRFAEAAQALAGRAVEVVERPEFTKGFVLLPKRWRVEQGVGALNPSRAASRSPTRR